MRRQRLKIIPDRVFHKLWDLVDKYDTQDDYISSLMSSDKIFGFKKYALDYAEASFALAQIYNLKNMPFKEIIEKAGTKKCTVSHIFCIPIRTVEDWYSGVNNSPSYIRLIILKYYHLLNLGKHIRLECDINYFKTKPSIYVKHKKISEHQHKTIVPMEDKPREDKSSVSYYEEYMMSEDYDEYLDRLIAKVKKSR